MKGDETIREVTRQLEHADEYVRMVLGNMMSFRRRSIEPVVRIGVTGDGKVPNYRIEPLTAVTPSKSVSLSGSETDFDAMLPDIGAYIEHVKAFNGRSHKDMEWNAFQLKGGNWSSKWMSIDDVQALLGEIRGVRKTRK